MRVIIFTVLALIGSAAAAASPQNVIFITWDGVRRNDVTGNRSFLPFFWGKRAAEGVVLDAEVANAARISLPGYFNLMAGEIQPCLTNDCSRIGVETLGERVKREMQLSFEEVASVSSWEKIPRAFESHVGATFTNAGFESVTRRDVGESADTINRLQRNDKPTWEENRFDKYTWLIAMEYLRKHKPRLLYISLNDTDDWAHYGDRPNYNKSLRENDQRLDELLTLLKSMGEYGASTSVILTTDHGRGEGAAWRNHNSSTPGSERIWIFAWGPKTPALGYVTPRRSITHSDVRPTIEKFLGLEPIQCRGCGSPVEEFFQ